MAITHTNRFDLIYHLHWYHLGSGATKLSILLAKYIPHLDKESFFELF